MAQAPPKKTQKLFHASNHEEILKLVKAFLHEHTPLATVLQDIVVEFLKRATTLFVSDLCHGVILAVDLENNNAVRVLAGKYGERGHVDGRGSEARFTCPEALAVDPASGALFVCDFRCIRRIAPDGTVTTLCGDPKEEGYREGAGSDAVFAGLSHCDCAVIGKDLFVCDTWNHCIRRIPLDDSSTSLFAGSPGQEGHVDGVGAEAKLHYPSGICRDGENNLIFADCGNHSIRKITAAGVVTTLAGSGQQDTQDGPAKEASFDRPESLTYDTERNRVLVREDSGAFRSIDLCTNQVSTIVEMGELELIAFSIVVDCTGDLFVSTSTGVFKVAPDGQMDLLIQDEEELGIVRYRIAQLL